MYVVLSLKVLANKEVNNNNKINKKGLGKHKYLEVWRVL
jgi:hypothetical protein